MNRVVTCAILITPIVFTASKALAQPGDIVYESLMNPAGGGIAFNFDSALEIGQSIALAGTARNVTQIDLYLGDNTSDAFKVRFYNLGQANGQPSDLIWESAEIQYPYTPPYYNQKVISVPVPGVAVPDELAWSVVPVDPTSAGNLLVWTGSLLPSIGSHLHYWERLSNLSWNSNLFSNGAFGAKLFAVPEPSTFSLVVIALAALPLRRRKSVPNNRV
jgi:hypothetical protein